jgi:hypothetical protein
MFDILSTGQAWRRPYNGDWQSHGKLPFEPAQKPPPLAQKCRNILHFAQVR